MDLREYIGFGETIRFQFRISLRYTIITTGAFVLGLFALWFWLFRGTVVEIGLLVILIWGLLYRLIYYFSTIHFVTKKAIYKKQGLLQRKITIVQQSEVDNMIIRQGFVERFLFGAGSICIDLKGSNRNYEVCLKRIADPAGKHRHITRVWTVI